VVVAQVVPDVHAGEHVGDAGDAMAEMVEAAPTDRNNSRAGAERRSGE
jgi:hypothetical protein